jgi:hypothetical protein
MVRATALILIAVAVLPMGLLGCKKKPPEQPVAVSPADQPAAPTAAPGATPQPTPTGQPSWPAPKWPAPWPDQGRPPDLAVPAKAPPGQPRKIATDADLAAYKAAMERAHTEEAVNVALNGAMPSLKACMDRHSQAAGDVRVSLRVHRSGHVISADISGPSSETQVCLERALRSVRVVGVQTDSITVQRTFKFNR